MEGITINKSVKIVFEERITFLKKRLSELQEEFKQANTNPRNAYNTQEKLKMINPNWKMEKLIFLNELSLREEILKDAIVVD